ncbi:MAG: RNA-directed DNA polymerase [Solirubrobacteraceae bacterium]
MVYTAAVGACLPNIFTATRWSQGTCDFATRLNSSKLDATEWMRNPFRGWKEFVDRSVYRCQTHPVVVVADIAGYFENISMNLLASDLRRIECPSPAIKLISECLNVWAMSPDRGIPQGVMASDILAKLYLEAFDEHMRNEGLVHVRYTDDIRVFARTRAEARRALVAVTRAARERGLTLQSAKTQIRMSSEAQTEFEGVVPIIADLKKAYIDEVRAAGMMEGDVSLPMFAVDELVGEHPHQIPAEVLHKAYEKFIMGQPRFNATLFRFVVKRLGRSGDHFAVDHATDLLMERPELTPAVADYIHSLADPVALEPLVRKVLISEVAATYPYQRYLMLDWLARNATSLEAATLEAIRQLAFRRESPHYIQAVARALVGKFGEHADLEKLLQVYRASSDPLERAQTLCCLERLERSRRNTLAGRVKDDSLLGWAAERVRAA